MNIIKPQVEYLENNDNIAHVAKCARVCYQSNGTNDEQLYSALRKNHHDSMFRHETHYYIIPSSKIPYDLYQLYCIKNKVCYNIGIDINFENNNYYIVTNGNYNINYPTTISVIKKYEVTPKEFEQHYTGYNMMRYTFRVITQISTSRELNRVSPNNIAEQSTRYVYENGSIVMPYWMKEYDDYKYNSDIYNNFILTSYIETCERAFNNYKLLIANGISKQDARGVLPLDTKTEVIYTYSIEEWKHIINLRYYGTTGAPHFNAKIIAGMIREELIQLGYNI